MHLKPAILLVLASSVVLVGCERLQGTLGIGKISPNPLRVIRQDPLAVPPNLALRPPLTIAGAGPGPAESGAVPAAAGADASRGEAAILAAAAEHDVEPQIRQLLERDRALEEAERSNGGGLLGALDVFGWFRDDDDQGDDVPPAAEEIPAAPPESGAEPEGGGLLDWLDIFDWFDDDE